MVKKRQSKYDAFNYCSSHKWIPKESCIIVELPSGLIQYRCPECKCIVRTKSRIARFRKGYVRTYIEIGEKE